MAFASLTIDLNARLANIEKDLGRSVQMAERSAQKMQAAFSGIGKAFGALGVIGAGGAFASMIKGLVDEADGLNDLATRTGTSVRSLASLQLAAKLADTDLQGLGQGLGKLSIFMAENADEARALGITARDPVEAFAQFSDQISAVADPAERNALAMRVLGKSYADLMPLLVQGGPALRQQAEASADYADRMARLSVGAAKFNDTLDELGQTGKTALLPLAEAFTEFASAAIDASEGIEGFDKVLSGLGQAGVVGQGIALAWSTVAYMFNAVGVEIAGIAAQFAALSRGDFKGAGVIGDAMKADAEKARAELDKLQERILFFQANQRKKPAQAPKSGGGAFDVESLINPGEADKLQSTLRKAFDIKPLDDFVDGFKTRRQGIEKEYAQLIAKLTGPSLDTATSLDLSTQIGQGRSALQGGDSTGTEIAVDRAKQMLSGLKDNGGADFEIRYYSDQLKQLELALAQSQQTTAETTRNALLENLNAAAAEVGKMDPLHIPIASDAIAQDLRDTLDVIRGELAANPLQVPVAATSAGGIYGDSNLSRAASKFGGR